jgi:hypothetical protein
MIGKQSTRQLFESLGPAGFAKNVRYLLGASDKNGRRYRDPKTGTQKRVAPKDSKGSDMAALDPATFSLRDLAEAILGESWQAKMSSPRWAYATMLQEEEALLEDNGAGAVTASAFADINAFTAVVSGLLEISLMDGWENPEFIMGDIMPDVPTRMFDGRKVIGTTRLGDVAAPRYPGEPTKRAGFSERWITQPRTVENALAVEVFQETVYLDLTGEVLEQANAVGDWLRWRKEMRQIDCFLGITSTYSYNGTSYSTYLQNGFYNNQLTGNELLFWEQIQTLLLLFRDMTDPATGLRVRIQPDSMFVNQDKLWTAQMVMGATEVELRGAPGATTGNQDVRRSANPVPKYKLYTSPLVYQRMTDASGLNLSATTAGKYWYLWDSKKPPFRYASNWPLRVQQAAPNQVDLIDRGIVLFVKGDERGVPMVYEPRRIVNSQP